MLQCSWTALLTGQHLGVEQIQKRKIADHRTKPIPRRHANYPHVQDRRDKQANTSGHEQRFKPCESCDFSKLRSNFQPGTFQWSCSTDLAHDPSHAKCKALPACCPWTNVEVADWLVSKSSTNRHRPAGWPAAAPHSSTLLASFQRAIEGRNPRSSMRIREPQATTVILLHCKAASPIPKLKQTRNILTTVLHNKWLAL